MNDITTEAKRVIFLILLFLAAPVVGDELSKEISFKEADDARRDTIINSVENGVIKRGADLEALKQSFGPSLDVLSDETNSWGGYALIRAHPQNKMSTDPGQSPHGGWSLILSFDKKYAVTYYALTYSSTNYIGYATGSRDEKSMRQGLAQQFVSSRSAQERRKIMIESVEALLIRKFDDVLAVFGKAVTKVERKDLAGWDAFALNTLARQRGDSKWHAAVISNDPGTEEQTVKWKLVFLYDASGEVREEYLTIDPVNSGCSYGLVDQ